MVKVHYPGWGGCEFDPRCSYLFCPLSIYFKVSCPNLWDQPVRWLVGATRQLRGTCLPSRWWDPPARSVVGPACLVQLWDPPVRSARGTGSSAWWDMMKIWRENKITLRPLRPGPIRDLVSIRTLSAGSYQKLIIARLVCFSITGRRLWDRVPSLHLFVSIFLSSVFRPARLVCFSITGRRSWDRVPSLHLFVSIFPSSVFRPARLVCFSITGRRSWDRVPSLHLFVSIFSSSVFRPVMSTHASVLVDSVGPPSAEVCRTAASFP
jgi:hypothetical protein